MDFRRLSVFCFVYEHRSVGRAAECLNITQPAVSLHIRRLEEELGCHLLRRSGRGIVPTVEGDLFYDDARKILDTFSGGRDRLRQLRNQDKQRLSVGCPTGALSYLLPILRSRQVASPNLCITLRTAVCHRICESVLDDFIEVAVVWAPSSDECLSTEHWITTKFVGVVDPQHPLAQLPEVSVDKVLRERLLLPVAESGTRMFLERALTDNDENLTAALEFDDVDALKQAVRQNLGVGFVAKGSVEEEASQGSLKVLQIEGKNLDRHLYLIHRKEKALSNSAQLLLETARAAASTQTRKRIKRADYSINLASR